MRVPMIVLGLAGVFCSLALSQPRFTLTDIAPPSTNMGCTATGLSANGIVTGFCNPLSTSILDDLYLGGATSVSFIKTAIFPI